MANTENKTKKLTKIQKYADVKSLIAGEAPANGLSVTDALDFIDHEVELLVKKNAPDSKKKLEADEAKGVNQQKILTLLGRLGENEASGLTATEILKRFPEWEAEDKSNQFVTRLITPLVENGEVIRTMVKGRARFTLAQVEEEG